MIVCVRDGTPKSECGRRGRMPVNLPNQSPAAALLIGRNSE